MLEVPSWECQRFVAIPVVLLAEDSQTQPVHSHSVGCHLGITARARRFRWPAVMLGCLACRHDPHFGLTMSAVPLCLLAIQGLRDKDGWRPSEAW